MLWGVQLRWAGRNGGSVVDGGRVHAVQMDLLIDRVVGESRWGRWTPHGATWLVHVVNARMDRMWWVHEGKELAGA